VLGALTSFAESTSCMDLYARCMRHVAPVSQPRLYSRVSLRPQPYWSSTKARNQCGGKDCEALVGLASLAEGKAAEELQEMLSTRSETVASDLSSWVFVALVENCSTGALFGWGFRRARNKSKKARRARKSHWRKCTRSKWLKLKRMPL
jgi:hypothetical protein